MLSHVTIEIHGHLNYVQQHQADDQAGSVCVATKRLPRYGIKRRSSLACVRTRACKVVCTDQLLTDTQQPQILNACVQTCVSILTLVVAERNPAIQKLMCAGLSKGGSPSCEPFNTIRHVIERIAVLPGAHTKTEMIKAHTPRQKSQGRVAKLQGKNGQLVQTSQGGSPSFYQSVQ